jgi:hypothetical protein
MHGCTVVRIVQSEGIMILRWLSSRIDRILINKCMSLIVALLCRRDRLGKDYCRKGVLYQRLRL